MYNITIIAVGKLKEKYLKKGLAEYLRRLQPYAKVTITEVNDTGLAEGAGPAEYQQVLMQEAARIKKVIPANSHIITCDLEGKALSSEQFAEHLAKTALYGTSKICFIIGGSIGVHSEIKKMSHLRLSFGKMTYPHQLMRLILIEQIYRCMRINSGEPYHK